ncbi:MAG: mechanosensitive ion channel domain-containing protein, partial [Myxococcota bacterium]
MPPWAEHITIYGGVGIAIAALLLLALPFVLTKPERKHIRVPFALFVVHIGLVVARALLQSDPDAEKPIEILEVFFLFGTITRSAYLLLLHWLVVRAMGQQVPKIVRDLLQALLWTGVFLVTLNAAGVSPSSILTTSALLTAVIGLSLQDTLGNLFAGLAIQAQAPFRVGDWIAFDDDEHHWGRVIEMSWRAVKVVTLEQVEMIVPNGAIAKSAITNFSAPTPAARRRVTVYAAADRSPDEVTETLLGALADVDGVAGRPAPDVLLRGFHERGVEYELRYFVESFGRRERVDGAVRSRVWYALQRARI